MSFDLESLGDAGACGEVEEVHRSPYEKWLLSTHPVEYTVVRSRAWLRRVLVCSFFVCIPRASARQNNVHDFREDFDGVRRAGCPG